MNEPRRSFDQWSFLVRVSVIATLATWLLIERVRSHDRTGTVLVVGIGYVILPIVAYFHTRYYNLKFMGWIVNAVKRRVAGQGRGEANHDHSEP